MWEHKKVVGPIFLERTFNLTQNLFVCEMYSRMWIHKFHDMDCVDIGLFCLKFDTKSMISKIHDVATTDC